MRVSAMSQRVGGVRSAESRLTPPESSHNGHEANTCQHEHQHSGYRYANCYCHRVVAAAAGRTHRRG